MTSPITCAAVDCAAWSALRNFARAAGSVSLVKGNAVSVKVSPRCCRIAAIWHGSGPGRMRCVGRIVRPGSSRFEKYMRTQSEGSVPDSPWAFRGAGVLVGEDAAGAELLQLDQREEAAHRPHSPGGQPVFDRVQVDRRTPVPPENPAA